MQNRNLIRTAEGVLTLMVLAVAPATSAWAMQPQPASVVQEAAQPQQNPSTPDQAQSKAKSQTLIVTGTIVKNGSDFVLKDDKGTIYRLDAQDKAAQFENKSVKVTGKLEPAASENQIAMLHVDAIEAMAA
jgi:uncharacterized protein YdeI (BOF family)